MNPVAFPSGKDRRGGKETVGPQGLDFDLTGLILSEFSQASVKSGKRNNPVNFGAVSARNKVSKYWPDFGFFSLGKRNRVHISINI